MTAPTVSSLRRELAVLRRRMAVARDRGLPIAELDELEAQIEYRLTNIEIAERVALQAAAGYRPVAA